MTADIQKKALSEIIESIKLEAKKDLAWEIVQILDEDFGDKTLPASACLQIQKLIQPYMENIR